MISAESIRASATANLCMLQLLMTELETASRDFNAEEMLRIARAMQAELNSFVSWVQLDRLLAEAADRQRNVQG